MINVGITGAGSHEAGELLRVLVNHPDVAIKCITDPELAGYDITSVHHGLIGECSLEFSKSLKLKNLDLIFAYGNHSGLSAGDVDELLLIELGADFNTVRRSDSLAVYGVPEYNRKALVRGARHAVIPSALEVIATIALQPLSVRSMLPDNLYMTVEASDDILSIQPESLATMIDQLTATGVKRFNVAPQFINNNDLGRVMRISCDLDMPLPIDNITDMYEELYDDHNLTFIVGEEVHPNEVEGTDKCIVSLDKGADGMLQLRAIADARLRGGAGDAVHVMNLLMGLFEKTGLSLKASRFQ